MAAELTINKSLTANGTIKVDDKIVMSLFTELSTSANGTDRVTQSIQDKETYNKTKRNPCPGCCLPGSSMGYAGFHGRGRQHNRGGYHR